ncbi:hypothetical protein Bpfe_029106 [Biomphalaria pfeifferi]|uniref:Uncharacterized protein n=1 Tax=Biomphalaria pfeifferi TaxID=112525 RepID=A0AAD8EV43_BIOPF|nr:hypothetical protein Bpfe_029106 [Biomphalaria pfeifferi]
MSRKWRGTWRGSEQTKGGGGKGPRSKEPPIPVGHCDYVKRGHQQEDVKKSGNVCIADLDTTMVIDTSSLADEKKLASCSGGERRHGLCR